MGRSISNVNKQGRVLGKGGSAARAVMGGFAGRVRGSGPKSAGPRPATGPVTAGRGANPQKTTDLR